MFGRVLIANRGEVAARVAATCRRLGIETVAVTSQVDRSHAWLASVDRVVCVGEAAARESYLNEDAILDAAVRYRCSALHPGWGFLSESASFAQRCQDAGVRFVGPRPVDIQRMGDKALAKTTMTQLGLPTIPGSDGVLPDSASARAAAHGVGYPVLLKAVAGGGGKGMRQVDSDADLEAAWDAATAEAVSSFGDGRLYLEKKLVGARHVEVQVFADRYGNTTHLGERECSLQRRHQKVLEESPSPALTEGARAALLERVAEAVRRSGYRNAGTVELLVDADENAYFLEMNTRLQVEHGVTEVRTGVDLVEWQLREAANQSIQPLIDALQHRGHAIECRINAEDPDQGFKPCPGEVSRVVWPEGPGIRVDTHLNAGDRIPPHYDATVAKVIAWGKTRDAAMERMRLALAALTVEGVTTNQALHERILNWEPFVTGCYDIHSLESGLKGGL